METRICKKCNVEKSIIEFYENKARKDGFDYLCKKCRCEYSRNNKRKNIIKVKERDIIYYQKNKEKINLRHKEYNKTHKRKYSKKYSKKYAREWREKARNNPTYRLNNNMRNAVKKSLKDKINKHWEKLVGYTRVDLQIHLENQFREGMTWENYGRWHIDHIIPKSIFYINGANSKGFKQCWALENLRPLWAEENNKKKATLFS